jgi:hypothetical protein
LSRPRQIVALAKLGIDEAELQEAAAATELGEDAGEPVTI